MNKDSEADEADELVFDLPRFASAIGPNCQFRISHQQNASYIEAD